MKRKFIFILIFVIYSILIFGKYEDDKHEIDNVIEIKAIVVEPLKLNLEEVEFGNIVRGQIKEQPDVQGKIVISGDKKSSVKIKIRYQEQELDITRDDQIVHLKNLDDKFNDVDIIYYPKFVLGSGQDEIINNNFSLGNGNINIYSRGKVIAPKTSEIGKYLGKMEVQVYYDK